MDEDLLQRKNSAHQLAEKFLTSPFQTMMIDGAWGAGKSWLAETMKNFISQNKISDKKYNVVWIDAFAHELTDDPLLIIWQHIIETLQIRDELSIKDIGLAIGKIIGIAIEALPIIGTTIKTAAKMSAVPQEKGFIEKKLSAIADMTAGKEELQSMLKTKLPLVIFIDELDRCNPHFAVRLFERVKHYFNMPDIKIIYVANKDILSGSIAGYYNTTGTKFEASDYLEKFIDFTFYVSNFSSLSKKTRGFFISDFIKSKNPRGNEFLWNIVPSLFDMYVLQPRQIKNIINNIILNSANINNITIFLLSIYLYAMKNSENYKYLYKIIHEIYKAYDVNDFNTKLRSLDSQHHQTIDMLINLLDNSIKMFSTCHGVPVSSLKNIIDSSVNPAKHPDALPSHGPAALWYAIDSIEKIFIVNH